MRAECASRLRRLGLGDRSAESRSAAVPLHRVGPPQTPSAWRQNGFYTVGSATNTTITIIASGDDFGTALLSDAEHLLDHAAEHYSALYHVAADDRWFSPAWTVVTL